MLTPEDFQAFDGYRRHAEAVGKQLAAAVNARQLAAIAATSSVLQNYRRQADAIAGMLGAVNARHLAGINATSSVLDGYRSQAEVIGKQLAAAINTKQFAAFHAAPPVLDGLRRHAEGIAGMLGAVNAKHLAAVNSLAPALDSYRRHAEGIAWVLPAVNGEHLAAVKAMAPLIQNYRQTAAIAMQLATVAAPVWAVPQSPPRSRITTTVPSLDWLLLGQYTLRILFAAIVLALIVALWEEQSQSTPAETIIGILAALKLWWDIDGEMWRRLR